MYSTIDSSGMMERRRAVTTPLFPLDFPERSRAERRRKYGERYLPRAIMKPRLCTVYTCFRRCCLTPLVPKRTKVVNSVIPPFFAMYTDMV